MGDSPHKIKRGGFNFTSIHSDLCVKMDPGLKFHSHVSKIVVTMGVKTTDLLWSTV